MFSFSFAQTIIPAGNVSGTWTSAGSPYLIQGSIMIPDNATLTIEPGVTVNFQGSYKLYAQGRLLAIGTAADTITFTAENTTSGWLGIQFDNTPTTNDTSKFFYCKLQYSKSSDGGGAFYLVNFNKAIISNCRISDCTSNAYAGGGGIHCGGSSPVIINNTICDNTTSYNGGGICCENSSPAITNNTIYNNSASGGGGGIYCGGIFNSSNAIISKNIILNNTASIGGGIFCSNNSPAISNNIISNNMASNGGGIYCSNDGSPAIINNAIYNNSASIGGGGIFCDYTYGTPTITNNTISNNSAGTGGALFCSLYCSVTLYNTIIFGNTASTSGQQVYLDDENSDPDFYYCDVQGGTAAFGLNSGIFYTGIYQNNKDTIPLFVSPSAESGAGHGEVTDDWSLQTVSACINAGTPDTTGFGLPFMDISGNPRISASRIDMGAYEYFFPNSINEKPTAFLMGIYPNPARDIVTVNIVRNSNEAATLNIYNMNASLVKTETMKQNQQEVNISDLNNGIYLVEIKSDGFTGKQKLIIQR